MASQDIVPRNAQPTSLLEAAAARGFRDANESDIPYADFTDVGRGGRPVGKEAQEAMDEYGRLIDRWRKGKKDFFGDAVVVDKSMEERLKLTASLAEHGVLDHEQLKPYHPYLVADRAALARPDPAEEAYERFQERRDMLRDRLNLETLRISAKEYQDLTINIQGAMAQENHIPLHRDFIAIRKEVAQENASHPRFVAEVAMGKGSLFDELLVDLDRGDLRDQENEAWKSESKIRAGIFSQAVAERANLSDDNTTNRIQAFGKMIAVGKQMIHDPLAIKEFAEQQRDKVAQERAQEYAQGGVHETPEVAAARAQGWGQLGGKDYELGMAALENRKFSPEMALSFFQSIGHGGDLPAHERDALFGPGTQSLGTSQTRKVAKDPALMFRTASAAFRQQFDAGDGRAGLSYAVMEHAAMQIMNDPEAVQRIAAVDLDAAQALEQFRPEHRKRLEEQEGGEALENRVFERMQEEGVLSKESHAKLAGTQITEKGEVDLESALVPKTATLLAYVDPQGGFRLAASEKGHESGDTLSLGGPFLREDGTRLDLTNGMKPGEPAPIYVEFQGDTVLVAASKDAMEIGDFAVLDDKFPSNHLAKGPGKSAPANGQLALENHHERPHESIKALLGREGPYIHVETGGRVQVAATLSDFEAGHSVPFSLYGVKVPPPGKDIATKDDQYDAGFESKKHLESILQRYGTRGLRLESVDGRDGEKELQIRLSTGEDASYRMIRDGYALPSECSTLRNHREDAANIASRGSKGLWANGFPEDDGNWRSESLMPHLTRKDKRDNLKRTVARAMAGSAMKAQRIFSDRSAELFALEIGTKWEHPGFYREAWEAVQTNPERMLKLYRNNVKLMKELRGRKDNMTEDEKVAHDQLTVGARLMGHALVNAGETVDPKTGHKSWKFVSKMDVLKDTEPMLSKRGIQIPKTLTDTMNKTIDTVHEKAVQAVQGGKQFSQYVLGKADEFTL